MYLSLTAPSDPETVLAVCKDLVPVKVLENIACYDMLLDLAANACKGDGPVVVDFVLFSLLEDCSHCGSLPVFGSVPVSKLF